MAFNVTATGDFYSVTPTPVRYLVDVFIDGGASIGTVNIESCNIEWAAQGEEMFTNPIKTSRCVVGLMVENDTDFNILNNLFTSSERKGFIRIKLYDTDVVYWSGPIIWDLPQTPYISYPQPFYITASCGLSILKNITFDPANWHVISLGQNTLSEYLCECVTQISQNFDDFVEYPITYLGKLYETSVDSLSPRLDYYEISDKAFYTTDGTAFTYWQVLEQICKLLNAKIMMADGGFQLIGYETYQTPTAVNRSLYLIDGSLDNIDTNYDNTLTLSSQGDHEREWLAAPQTLYFAGLKSVVAKAYASPNMMKDAVEDGVWSASPSLFTSYDGKGVILFNYPDVQQEITGGSGKKLKISFDLNKNDDTIGEGRLIYIILDIGTTYGVYTKRLIGGWNYLKNSYDQPTWGNTLSGANYYIMPVTAQNQTHWVLETIDLPFTTKSVRLQIALGGKPDFVFSPTTSMAPFSSGGSLPTNKFYLPDFITAIQVGDIIYTSAYGGVVVTAVGTSYKSVILIECSGQVHNNTGYFTIYVYKQSVLASGDEVKVKIDNLELNWIDYDTATYRWYQDGAYEYRADNNNVFSLERQINDLYIGDFLGSNANRSVKIWNGAAWVYSSAWAFDTSPTETSRTIWRKICESQLWSQRTAIERWQGQINTGYYSPEICLDWNNGIVARKLMFNGGSVDLCSGIWQGEWVNYKRVLTGVTVGPDDTLDESDYLTNTDQFKLQLTAMTLGNSSLIDGVFDDSIKSLRAATSNALQSLYLAISNTYPIQDATPYIIFDNQGAASMSSPSTGDIKVYVDDSNGLVLLDYLGKKSKIIPTSTSSSGRIYTLPDTSGTISLDTIDGGTP